MVYMCIHMTSPSCGSMSSRGQISEDRVQDDSNIEKCNLLLHIVSLIQIKGHVIIFIIYL